MRAHDDFSKRKARKNPYVSLRALTPCVGAALVIASVAMPTLAATMPTPGARIVEVTVFPDRAEIVREVKVDLPAGATTLQFAGLPWRVEADSIRVSAKGVAATLGAVELKEAAAEAKDTPEMIAARDELTRIESDLATLNAEEATGKELREFITSLKAATGAKESLGLAQGKADLASIQAVYAMVRTSLVDLSKESLTRGDRRRKLAKETDVARAKLAAAGPEGAIRTRTAAVDVETKQAGALTLRLAYLAPGASWRPAYRAALDAATGEASWTSEAVVTQSTGEEWSGVALRLSTAAPARGVEPPRMTSLLLRPVEMMAAKMARGRAEGGFAGVASANAPETPDQRNLELTAGITDSDSAGNPAVEMKEEDASPSESSVVRSAYNVAFEVPGRSDVPADGRDHRAGLRQETLTGKIEYRTAPALNAAAFLVSKTKAPPAYPLLAGPVRVFAAGAYLGSFDLPETAPGAELDLPFGVDNRITIDRTPLPQTRSASGIFGKDRRIAHAFRTTIENLRDQKVTLVLEDRIPVSEDERVQVEMGKGTTPGWKDAADRPGILEWSYDLAPREKREVILEYTVRYPKDLFIPGLD